MNYRYVGVNRYEITLTVFRDCYNGIPPFDNPAVIGIFDGSNDLINNLQVSITSKQPVPNAINSPCMSPPTDVCYEIAKYVFDITIPATGGPFTVAYQRCCRNSSVINLINVQATGATYFTVIDPSLAPINSNPVFSQHPSTFICKNVPFTFDQSAVDADGDSLVYELIAPYDGGSQSNPIPDPPDAPPYSHVTFKAPYSTNDPLGGIPMSINSHTGILTGTPSYSGQFVYGIVIKEYRNGVLIGQTTRDFQINVNFNSCQDVTVASIYPPAVLCGTRVAEFVNNSYNAATYSWSFGDPTSSSDSSNLKNPSYTYPDTGVYLATLIAYSSMNPDCNDTAYGMVHVYPEFFSRYNVSNVHCSNMFEFYDMSHGVSGTANTWIWKFGDDSVSNVKNPIHTFAEPGTYNVVLIASADSACNDTMTKTVHVLPVPVSDFSVSLDTCNYEISLINNSINASASRWDFGNYSTLYFKEGKYKYKDPGTYSLLLTVVTDSSCKDTSAVTITIPPLPVPDFSYSVAQCDSVVQFTNLSQNASDTHWDFGDNEFSVDESPVHSYTISGKIPVTLTVESEHHCKSVLNKEIFFVSKKRPDFDISIDSCKGEIAFLDLTNRAAYYEWDFGDGAISNEINPVHKFIEDGRKSVKLIVNPGTLCVDSIVKEISFEVPLGEKVFIPNSFTPNGDGHNDIYTVSIFRPCDIYHLTIYNRWGQKVFETSDATNVHWDGRYNGEQLANDVYVYIIENNDNRKEGTITILR